MKSQFRNGLLLLVACVSISILPGCEKEEPCKRRPKNEEPQKQCTMNGSIVQLPGTCSGYMSNDLGILGEDGKYYQIQQDLTGYFGNYREGQGVRFGYSEIQGPCTIVLSCNAPNGDHCIVLSCIQPSRFCGTPVCNTPALVVEQKGTGMGPLASKVLKIDGKHYVVTGSYSETINSYEAGTELLVSHEIVKDCILPAVVTDPPTDGCIELKCATR